MGYKETYEAWLANPYFDEATKDELKAIAGDDKEIKERFYADLEFGTAGLIPDACHRNLQMRQPAVWQPTESKRMYLNP